MILLDRVDQLQKLLDKETELANQVNLEVIENELKIK